MVRKRSAPETTVSVTPGQNKPVEHVIKFEELVARAKQGAAKRTRERAAPAQRDQLGAVGKLAAELEAALRELRASTPDEPARASSPRTRARKRKS